MSSIEFLTSFLTIYSINYGLCSVVFSQIKNGVPLEGIDSLRANFLVNPKAYEAGGIDKIR